MFFPPLLSCYAKPGLRSRRNGAWPLGQGRRRPPPRRAARRGVGLPGLQRSRPCHPRACASLRAPESREAGGGAQGAASAAPGRAGVGWQHVGDPGRDLLFSGKILTPAHGKLGIRAPAGVRVLLLEARRGGVACPARTCGFHPRALGRRVGRGLTSL